MATPGLHPGKPNSIHQAFSTAYWDGLRLVTYVSGNNLVILSQPSVLRQTIYLDRDGGAVDIEESTGNIAVVSGPKILIYAPSAERGPLLQWMLQWTLHLDLDDGVPNGVNWGNEQELLVAGKTVSLWAVMGYGPHRLWKKTLAVPAMLSAFSFDSYLAATVGKNDKLVKVWRRFSYDMANADFDFSYLAHPRAVTELRWRRPFSRSQSMENILYTVCADGVLRIWAPTDSVESSYMQMWSSLDLFDVLPRSLPGELRYATIIDNKDFTRATESAVRNAKDDPVSKQRMEHLIEVASKNPDVCVVFDQAGRMAVFGIENIGSRVRRAFSIFEILYDSTPVQDFPQNCQHLSFLGFGASTSKEPDFVLLIHDFNAGIRQYESNFSTLLYPQSVECRLRLTQVWTGHYKSVQSLVRTADGKAMLSSSNHAENIIWKPRQMFGTVMLEPASIIMAPDKVQRAIILLKGQFVITMQSFDLVLWDCRSPKAKRIASSALVAHKKRILLNLFLLPENFEKTGKFHVLAVYNDRFGIVWEAQVPTLDLSYTAANGHSNQSKANGTTNGSVESNGMNGTNGTLVKHAASISAHLKKLGEFKFPVPAGDTLVSVLSVDPVGWTAELTGSIDSYARDVVTSISSEGMVRSWTARMAHGATDPSGSVQWLETASVDTGIKSLNLAKGSTMKKIALVDESSTRLTIWDIGEQHLEYEERFKEGDTIKDLDWTCTPDSQSILAIGFSNRVLLYCQLRFDYTKELPAWAVFREINIRRYTPRVIGDSIWLEDGTLVIGSGNQLFTHDKRVDTHKAIQTLHLSSHKVPFRNIFDIVSVLNGPLPLYHPQFVAQSIFVGKTDPVRKVFVTLLKELKFTVPSEANVADIDSLVGMRIEDFIQPTDAMVAQPTRQSRAAKYSQLFSTANLAEDQDFDTFNEGAALALTDYLKNVSLPYLTSHQQISLTAIVEGMGQVEEQRSSLDENGVRYFLAFRLFILHRESMIQMPYRDHNWAYHSESQEVLVDLIMKSYNGRMTWQQARESGMFVWLRSSTAAREQFEAMARIIYTNSEPRNPVDCTLFYLALRKKQILLGLWRMASYHKEQRAMMKFLANNFSEPRWKTAALKNAYVLLSKQRYEYAAAFFLLADSLKDAVNVCLKNLHDLQLAIAIARIYEGDDNGPVYLDLLQKEVLPLAYRTGDRWLASLAFYQLGRKDMALKCIISSYRNEITLDEKSGEAEDLESKMFLVEDPVLVVLYRQIRDSLRVGTHASIGITPAVETQFVLHIAKLYDRMGCDLLALDLARNWKFVNKLEAAKPPPQKSMLDMWG
ncbi:RAVE protein 1 C terminal-domain-containing protein [Limtongia smithiae]|uniref:RAVE protein 1 C terminal-domain-containing protein n=1 Tax=Limtongia smithiae TaxID=1125753 RepID=UPI0034CEAF79